MLTDASVSDDLSARQCKRRDMPHDQKTGGYAYGSSTDLLTGNGSNDSGSGCLYSTKLFGRATVGCGVINVNPTVLTHRLFLH